jgi:simple sugar transport system permease protein
MEGAPATKPAASPAPPRARPGFVDFVFRYRESSILLVAIVLAGYFQFRNGLFLGSQPSLENLSQFLAPWTIIACGEIMLMIGGEIDLSAGMTFAFAPFILFFAAQAGVPVIVALLLAVVASAMVGLVNGLVTVVLGIPSFVTTLGTLFLLNGITLTISHGSPVSPPGSPQLQAIFGNWGFAELIWAVVVVLAMHVVLRHTRWGLHTIAAGANRLGARESGINVARLQIGNFVICGMLAGFTGILEGYRIQSSDPLAGGTQVMFYAVAGAVIGGTPLTGGSGTMIGGLIGALVLAVLQDGLTLIGTNAFVFPTILGAAILAAMLFNLNVSRLRRTGGV